MAVPPRFPIALPSEVEGKYEISTGDPKCDKLVAVTQKKFRELYGKEAYSRYVLVSVSVSSPEGGTEKMWVSKDALMELFKEKYPLEKMVLDLSYARGEQIARLIQATTSPMSSPPASPASDGGDTVESASPVSLGSERESVASTHSPAPAAGGAGALAEEEWHKDDEGLLLEIQKIVPSIRSLKEIQGEVKEELMARLRTKIQRNEQRASWMGKSRLEAVSLLNIEVSKDRNSIPTKRYKALIGQLEAAKKGFEEKVESYRHLLAYIETLGVGLSDDRSDRREGVYDVTPPAVLSSEEKMLRELRLLLPGLTTLEELLGPKKETYMQVLRDAFQKNVDGLAKHKLDHDWYNKMIKNFNPRYEPHLYEASEDRLKLFLQKANEASHGVDVYTRQVDEDKRLMSFVTEFVNNNELLTDDRVLKRLKERFPALAGLESLRQFLGAGGKRYLKALHSIHERYHSRLEMERRSLAALEQRNERFGTPAERPAALLKIEKARNQIADSEYQIKKDVELIKYIEDFVEKGK